MVIVIMTRAVSNHNQLLKNIMKKKYNNLKYGKNMQNVPNLNSSDYCNVVQIIQKL